MANYLMKYKGIYRIMPELDRETNDFIRDENDNIEDADIYIACQHGSRITTYGHIDGKKAVWLSAYIPSIGRGRNVVKELKKQDVNIEQYEETDEEVQFIFLPKDIEIVAKLMKAKTSGASISPFSTKNLGKRKDVVIPEEALNKYKEITSVVPKSDLLMIHRITNSFLENVLQKELKKGNKEFDYKTDMKKLMLARQVKEYIFYRGYWDEYLEYLNNSTTNAFMERL